MRETKRLPDAELAVMQEVWNAPDRPVLSSWVTERLADRWKTTSVLTFLSRLCDKGFLQCEKQGKMNAYQPLVSRDDYGERESVSLLHRFYQGSVRDLIASLSNTGAVTQDDLDELRDFLNEQGRDTK